MSEAELPNPLTDPNTAERNEGFFNAGVVLDHIRACILFPPELDFSKACSCVDCVPKIAMLKASEKEIKAKMDLIGERVDQVQNNELICSVICNCAWWTKQMLDVFNKKLEALYKSEKSGVPLRLEKSRSAQNLRELDLEIRRMMVDCGLLVEPDDDDDEDHDRDHDVLDEIERGRFYYGKTRAKDTAYALLQNIEDIEKDHDEHKKTAEAKNKMPDPSISKKYIENQVELVKKLPVQELRNELVELITDVQSRETDWEMFREARGYIYRICSAVIIERNAFWKGSPKDNCHKMNGVNQTLDSIIAKLTLFEHEWKKVHATFIASRDRANPKRQRT